MSLIGFFRRGGESDGKLVSYFAKWDGVSRQEFCYEVLMSDEEYAKLMEPVPFIDPESGEERFSLQQKEGVTYVLDVARLRGEYTGHTMKDRESGRDVYVPSPFAVNGKQSRPVEITADYLQEVSLG